MPIIPIPITVTRTAAEIAQAVEDGVAKLPRNAIIPYNAISDYLLPFTVTHDELQTIVQLAVEEALFARVRHSPWKECPECRALVGGLSTHWGWCSQQTHLPPPSTLLTEGELEIIRINGGPDECP